MSTRSARGFTLIELMVVVAIVGILSSIAIPTFRNFQLRTKQAERSIMMTSIRGAIDDIWARDGKFPWDLGGGWTYLYLAYDNPDANPGTHKRPWRIRPINTFDHWSQLSLVVQGNVYYSYYGYAYQSGATRYYDVRITGDLDGDGVRNVLEYEWSFNGTAIQTWAGGTAKCSYCTRAFETYPRAF